MGWGAYHRLLHWLPSIEGYLLLAGINCEASCGMGRMHVFYIYEHVKIVCVFWIHLRFKGCEKSCGFFFLRKLKFRHFTRLGIFRSYKRWWRHMTDGLLLTGIHDVVSLWRVNQNDVIIFFSHIIGVNCMKLKARKKIRVFRKLINYLCNTIILYRALLLFYEVINFWIKETIFLY